VAVAVLFIQNAYNACLPVGMELLEGKRNLQDSETNMWLSLLHATTSVVRKKLVLLEPNEENGEQDTIEFLHLCKHSFFEEYRVGDSLRQPDVTDLALVDAFGQVCHISHLSLPHLEQSLGIVTRS